MSDGLRDAAERIEGEVRESIHEHIMHLASATDIINTYCREEGVYEAEDINGLRNAIHRVAWAMRKKVEALEAENAELQAMLQIHREYFARVLSEPCQDEQHCVCVPGLKHEIDRLRGIVAAVKEAIAKELEEHRESN